MNMKKKRPTEELTREQKEEMHSQENKNRRSIRNQEKETQTGISRFNSHTRKP
jgi:hypothetical protein